MEVSKDLVQDVFIQVYMNKSRIEVHTTLKGYLLTSLRNRFFNYKRDVLSKKADQDAIHSIDLQENMTHDYINHKEILQQSRNAIAELPEQCRKVFLLSREEGMQNQEIAAALGISVKTVEAHITKAIKYLRENISYQLWWLPIIDELLTRKHF